MQYIFWQVVVVGGILCKMKLSAKLLSNALSLFEKEPNDLCIEDNDIIELITENEMFKDKMKQGNLIGDLKESDMKHIYPILNYRYLNYLPTLISTECTPQLLIKLDEALAGRILECCGKRFGVVFKNDCNYRLKQFLE